MTTPVRRRDLPHITIAGRHAGELLAHPCHCGHRNCTIGEHVWHATRDMTPGPQAQNIEPGIYRHNNEETDNETAADTGHDFAEYRAWLTAYHNAATGLIRFIDRHRPDRTLPASAKSDGPPPADWCRSCLRIGICKPPYRGDLCRWDYDFCRTYGLTEPPIDLVRARHEGTHGRRITEQMIHEALAKTRQERRDTRRKRRRTS